MKKYTLGFIFNESLDKVLLMHKLKPAFQIGMLNGLGGKIEEGESGGECIVREISEEIGLLTKEEDWISVGSVGADTVWHMEVYAYIYKGTIRDIQSLEEEQVEWFGVGSLPSNILSNLQWLIPLCLDKIEGNGLNDFRVTYIHRDT